MKHAQRFRALDEAEVEFQILDRGEVPAEANSGISIFNTAEAHRILGLDAGETLVTATNALQHVQQESYNRYRPSQFRTIMAVSSDVPEWADNVKYEIYAGYARWEPGKEDGTTAPGAEIVKSEAFFKVKDFWSSYGYTRREIMLAAKVGAPLITGRANVVMQGAEQTLEDICANGHAGTGLGGLRGLTGFTVATARAKTGGGTAWLITQPGYEWIDDLLTLEQAVVNGSKQTSAATVIVLPLAKLQLLQAQRNAATDRRTYVLALEALQTAKTLIGWAKLDGTGEAYAFDATDQEVIQMVIAAEPKQLDPIIQPLGSARILCMMSVGGVISKMPSAIAKMTGI